MGLTWWDWLAGPSVAMLTIISLVIWVSAGGYMLLFLAGLQNISSDVYEAAAIDGASRWRTMRSITVPLLRPTLFTVLTLGLIGTWQVFDQVYIMSKGNPGKTTLTPAFLSYDQSINNGEWGTGTAMSFVLFAIIIVFTAVQTFALRDRDQRRARSVAARSARDPARATPACPRIGNTPSATTEASHEPGRHRSARGPGAGSPAPPRPHATRTAILKAFGYSALVVFALLYLFPFIIQIGTSFKTDADATANPLNPIPETFTTAAYQSLFQQDLPLWFSNSVIVAVFVTAGRVFFDSLAGYALARLRFRGRGAVTLAIVATMAVPGVVLLIPKFLIIKQFGIYDAYTGMIVPFLADAAGVFIMKNFFEGIPVSLEEAAKLDGAGVFRTFWSVVLPIARPALITITIIAFQTRGTSCRTSSCRGSPRRPTR